MFPKQILLLENKKMVLLQVKNIKKERNWKHEEIELFIALDEDKAFSGT